MPAVSATAKNLRVSARKLGLVASLVRGRSLKDSEVILQHTPKVAAPVLAKVLKSARANAENNQKLDADKLVVESILVSNSGMIKRFRAGARGMVRPIRHRTSHVTVVLDEIPKPVASSGAAKNKVAVRGSEEPSGSRREAK